MLIKKEEHTMQLFAAGAQGKEEAVRSSQVGIGPGGLGPKRQEGDMTHARWPLPRDDARGVPVQGLSRARLPDRRRPSPLQAPQGARRAPEVGDDWRGIAIHGPPVSLGGATKKTLKESDWTAGCIAVNEDEIVEIARLVRDGTVVHIED